MKTKINLGKVTSILFLVLCVSLIAGGSMTNINSGNHRENGISNTPFAAADTLPGDYLNITDLDGETFVDHVYRETETVLIKYDQIIGSGHVFVANIVLENNDQFNLTMTEGADNNWTVPFTPSIYNATGIATVMIMDVLGGVAQDNVPLADVGEIEIWNNLPQALIELNTSSVLRGESVAVDIIPSDIENPVGELEWELRLQDKDGGADVLGSPLLSRGVGNLSYVLDVDLIDEVGEYQFNATCWDLDGNQTSRYYDLDVVNNEPSFVQFEFELNEESVTTDDLKTAGILRSTDLLIMKVNVTDAELTEDFSLSISITNPLTKANLFSRQGIAPTVIDPTYFDVNFSLPVESPLGKVDMIVSVIETVNEADYQTDQTFELLVKNNAPTINDIFLNEESEEQITLTSADSLEFTFDVEDEEGLVEYVEVILQVVVDGDLTEYTFGVLYTGSSTAITIRAIDLPAGNYQYSVIVYDRDGLSAESDFSGFAIEADPSIDPMVWLMLVVGLIVGAAITAGLIFGISKTPVKPVASEPKSKGKKNHASTPKDNKSKSGKTSKTSGSSNKKKKKKVIRKL